MCYTLLAQRFEPQGTCCTNFHYYFNFFKLLWRVRQSVVTLLGHKRPCCGRGVAKSVMTIMRYASFVTAAATFGSGPLHVKSPSCNAALSPVYAVRLQPRYLIV